MPSDHPSLTEYHLAREPVLLAQDLFHRTRWKARFIALRALVTGRPCRLAFLGDVEAQYDRVAVEHLPTAPVDLDKVVGSYSRSLNFDCEWNPLDRNTEDRWVSVCVGMLESSKGLPPVDLVEVQGLYYVTDGHHRVSVARALGKTFLDADVKRWQVHAKGSDGPPGS